MSEIFIATIWPFAEKRITEIRQVIEKYHPILEVKKFKFSTTWPRIVDGIYADDKIKKNRYIEKIEALAKCPRYVYLIYIAVNNPNYRFKDDGRKLSKTMEALKKIVRRRFGSKKIANQNPIHIPDNLAHCNNYAKFLETVCI